MIWKNIQKFNNRKIMKLKCQVFYGTITTHSSSYSFLKFIFIFIRVYNQRFEPTDTLNSLHLVVITHNSRFLQWVTISYTTNAQTGFVLIYAISVCNPHDNRSNFKFKFKLSYFTYRYLTNNIFHVHLPSFVAISHMVQLDFSIYICRNCNCIMAYHLIKSQHINCDNQRTRYRYHTFRAENFYL